jgi:hypothetical protein
MLFRSWKKWCSLCASEVNPPRNDHPGASMLLFFQNFFSTPVKIKKGKKKTLKFVHNLVISNFTFHLVKKRKQERKMDLDNGCIDVLMFGFPERVVMFISTGKKFLLLLTLQLQLLHDGWFICWIFTNCFLVDFYHPMTSC